MSRTSRAALLSFIHTFQFWIQSGCSSSHYCLCIPKQKKARKCTPFPLLLKARNGMMTSDGISLARTQSHGHINIAAREPGVLRCTRPQLERSISGEEGGWGSKQISGGGVEMTASVVGSCSCASPCLPRAECCGSDRCVTRRECPSLGPPRRSL